MGDDAVLEVARHYKSLQDKYTYFLLTAAGACIALSVRATSGSPIKISQLPLGLAVLAWGASIICGCQFLRLLGGMTYKNYEWLLWWHRAANRQSQPNELASARAQEESQFERGQKKAGFLSNIQFYSLLLGGVFYLIWHILEMAKLTNAS
jgi:hypothetical protein